MQRNVRQIRIVALSLRRSDAVAGGAAAARLHKSSAGYWSDDIDLIALAPRRAAISSGTKRMQILQVKVK